MSQEPLLRPEEVASVLSPGEDGEPAASTEPRNGPSTYSLREPVAIPPGGEAGARDRLTTLMKAVEQVLSKELERELTLELDGFRQQRSAAALAAVNEPAWVVSFAHADGGGIALILNPLTALAIVELALGGFGNAPDTGRMPTPLETRVMNRLTGALVPSLVRASGEDLSNATVDVGRIPANLASPGEIVGVGLVRVQIGESQQTSALVASTALLVPRKTTGTDEEFRVGPLHRVLRRCRADVRPVLRAGMVGLEDLLALSPGAVLRLDVSDDAAMDLRVSGQTVFTGSLGRDAGPTFAVAWRRGRVPATGGKEKS